MLPQCRSSGETICGVRKRGLRSEQNHVTPIVLNKINSLRKPSPKIPPSFDEWKLGTDPDRRGHDEAPDIFQSEFSGTTGDRVGAWSTPGSSLPKIARPNSGHNSREKRHACGRTYWRQVAAGILLLFICCWRTWSATPATQLREPGVRAGFSQNRLLIQPKLDANPLELARFHAANRCSILRRFPAFDEVQVLQLPEDIAVPEMARRYQASALVNFAEPDHLVKLASVFPNDPLFLNGTQWGLNNAGQAGGMPNADIDAPEAWTARTSASNVVVAVVDTGIRYMHEDLAGNIWTNPHDGSHGINVIAGSTDPDDDNGHGTLVSGVIGARGDNGVGVAGVAWQVQLMACKFVDTSGYGSVSDALVCLDYARTNGAQIINASWGMDEFSLSLSNAMAAMRDAGILVVAAAGNDARDIDDFPYYPASFDLDNIVTVAATTRHDGVYTLSNFGLTNVGLAAPGYEIYSTACQSNNAYASDEGTSMAAAYVSGAAAVLRAAYPTEPPAQIINRLLISVDPLPGLAGHCVSGGRLNLRRALGVPLTAPVLKAAVASSGDPFVLLLSGNPGRNHVTEDTTNFSDWLPVSTNLTGFDGLLAVTNQPTGSIDRRFYRAYLRP